jgi:hypothetical protein
MSASRLRRTEVLVGLAGLSVAGVGLWAPAASAAVVRPVVSSVSPAAGPVTGGTQITVTGSGFKAGAAVELSQLGQPGANALTATDIHVVSPSKITATTPRGTRTGTYHVYVVVSHRNSANRAGDRFAYAPTAAWSEPTQITAPVNKEGFFNGVSCTGDGDCTAVGADADASAEQFLFATETAGSWGSATEIPSPSGAGAFNAVSCSGAGDCTAVGGDDQPAYATETAGSWGTPTEIPSLTGSGIFRGVSCTDADDCTAVGENGNGPAYATEAAGSWSVLTNIDAPSGGGFFFSVSCTSANDCTAVGNDGASQPFYATETAGSWGTATEIPAPGGGGFNGVSCTSAGNCTAVGQPAGSGQPFYSTETAGDWGAITEIDAPGGAGAFEGVSCPIAGNCTAVGSDGNNRPFYATETAGGWGAAAAIDGSGAFEGVGCPDTGHCTAVGEQGNVQPFYATATVPPRPTVSRVSPNTGPVAGGTQITITGSGFVAGAKVEIGQGAGPGPTAISAINVTVVSPTEITATTGRAAHAGSYQVWVLTQGGANNNPPSAGRFTYTTH